MCETISANWCACLVGLVAQSFIKRIYSFAGKAIGEILKLQNYSLLPLPFQPVVKGCEELWQHWVQRMNYSWNFSALCWRPPIGQNFALSSSLRKLISLGKLMGLSLLLLVITSNLNLGSVERLWVQWECLNFCELWFRLFV